MNLKWDNIKFSMEYPQSKTILIVDDDRIICDVLELTLGKQGFKTITAYNGQRALEVLQARTRKIHLVVLDLMMPGRDGYEVLKELQGRGFQNVPIFVVTARTLDKSTIELIGMESNVEGFFTKPIDFLDFNRKAHSVLGTLPPARTESSEKET